MYIAILGRQPDISMAELESRFGADGTRWFSSQSATIKTDTFSINELGGTQKAGIVTAEYQPGSWQRISQEIIATYTSKWSGFEGKITLGISAYGFPASGRDAQKIGITIKQKLKKGGVSLRLIPNTEAHLNTAASHHNKLGLSPNKVELLIVRGESGRVIVAESTGAQNITALARRDQGRPKRDAFAGMLPPKLAQIMLNLAIGPLDPSKNHCAVLDPFCGTGVILQEALLRGCLVFGTDLNPKMIDYTLENISWLQKTHHVDGTLLTLRQGDAMAFEWLEVGGGVIDAVVCETYLGQPFSAPPSPKKLDEVKKNVNHITTSFLKNIHPQLQAGTPLCLAVPAWRDAGGRITHLPFTHTLGSLGYSRVDFKHVENQELIYYREDQIVARELLVLVKA